MHRLILLRHAHAEPGGARDDRLRPLSHEGEREADAVGRWLQAQGFDIARAICSPALRARDTAERVLASLPSCTLDEDSRIYDATPGELIGVAEEHRAAGCLLMVGHNPGFEQLAALLATGQTGDHRGMPPAGVAVLEFSGSATALEPGSGRLTAFWSP